MKLYQAVYKLDAKDTFFLVYPDGSVAPMPPCDIELVKYNIKYYARDPAVRFEDAVDPVLIAEW